MIRKFPILHGPESRQEFSPWTWRDDWFVNGESAFSLLTKFQHLNELSFSDLVSITVNKQGANLAAQDVDLRDARRFDIPVLMNLLRTQLPEVVAAFVIPSSRILKIGSPNLCWCEKCANEGVHLTAFQYRFLDLCPLHRTKLRRQCEYCGASIPYRLRSSVFKAPLNCPTCAQPWWVPDLGPDDLSVGRAYRELLRRHAGDTLLGIRLCGGVPQNNYAIGGLPPMRSEPKADQAFLWRLTDEQWCIYGLNVKGDVDIPSLEHAMPANCDIEIDVQARACYRSVRRRLMLLYGKRHRSCICSAARHFGLPLTGRTTTSFCPVALAFLRWRCKWEGISVPRALLEPALHAPLGLAVWLSSFVPIAPKSWDSRAVRWMTLHLLVQACMDSFRFFLEEAVNAGEHRQILWLPFPVHEFPERITLVRGGADEEDSIGFCALPRGDSLGKWPARIPGTGDHYMLHTRQLLRNVFLDYPE